MNPRLQWMVMLGSILCVSAGFVQAHEQPEPRDWLLYRGTPDRQGLGQGGTPFLQPRWHKATYEQITTRGWIEQTINFVNQRNLPLLPAAFPITATITKNGNKVQLLFYRSHWGIHAFNVKTGDLEWKNPSAWSLDTMASKPNKQPAINNWVLSYMNTLQKPNLVFENTTLGTLSSDGVNLYAIEDLAVSPPMPQGLDLERFSPGGILQRYDKSVSDAIQHNRLQAHNLVTGKLIWELGGRGEKASELADVFFLGAPLPIEDNLYLLLEKQGKILLAGVNGRSGKLARTTELFYPPESLLHEGIRRMQAAHLAAADNRIVCPTNTGAMICVDLKTAEVLWTFNDEPRPNPASPPTEAVGNARFIRRGVVPPGWVMGPNGQWMPAMLLHSRWQVSAPIIQEGKVVFTVPNSRAVHCINLSDGSRVWMHNRAEDDLYLAGVFNGKVLIVGKRNVRALSLSKGETLWRLEAGLPSGQGIASDNIYYLPLKSAVQSNEPEICSIDMERGIVQAHTKSRKKEVPGNLIFADGMVISQTLTEVVAFQQLKAKLTEVNERLKANVDDPVGLSERGELRLDSGDLQGAVEDLTRALKNNLPEEIQSKVRIKLYETLTEYFQRDFNSAEKYTDVYEELCKVDLTGADSEQEKRDRHNEARRRRANFLSLVAKGKEAQRKLVEAFERYLEFSAVAGKDELISVIDEPSVRAAADVWSQGRIRAMAESATAEERKPLEERIRARWKEVQTSKSLDDLRNLVTSSGSLFQVGKEARLMLAEHLMDHPDSIAVLEAERHLYLLRGIHEEPVISARAVECLARLNIRKGMLPDAAYYYRVLLRDFGNMPVRDGKTGADLFNEQANDKRMLPYLEESNRLRSDSRTIKVKEEAGTFPYQNQVYQLGEEGERIPYFRENQLVIRYQPHSLRLLESASGEEKWNQPLPQTMFQNLVYGTGQSNMTRFSFFNLGHLVVLPLGHLVFGIDPINRKVLWERDLHASSLSAAQPHPNLTHTQLSIDPRDGTVLVTYADGWTQRLGMGSLFGADVVCLQTRDALVGIDPITGRSLWTRSDVNQRSRIFRDEQVLYVVDMNGDNRATTTRALRTYDGGSVKVPDFTALYEKHVAMSGRTFAVSEPGPKNGMMLLYDVATSKDVWKGDFSAGSVLLKSEDQELAGMIDPHGKLRVVNLRLRKEVLTASIDPRHIKDATTVWLLSDGQDYYVAVNGPLPPPAKAFGGIQSNLLPGTGLRAIPVNGMVYCFNGITGKVRWYNEVLNQMLVLEHFRELPFVLFTSRLQLWKDVGDMGRSMVWHVAVHSIQKSNGKVVCDSTNIPSALNFHALNVNARASKAELVGHQMKIVFQVDADPGKP